MNRRFKTEDLRRKMKDRILCVFALLIFSTSWSQSVLETKELIIKKSFDNLTLQSYAVQGELKVQELISYLQLIENKNNSTDLNKQISLNIEQLFNSEAHLTGIESKADFFSPENWLKDWTSEGVTINSVTLLKSQLEDTSWIYEYQINYSKNGKQKTKKLTVRVKFQPRLKAFGNSSKVVWDLKIESIIFK